MQLSLQNLDAIRESGMEVPAAELLQLPEKVLQFGTGVLLRGLPDYFIDLANQKGIFNGRIIVVKSTTGGDAAAFIRQDQLYTLCTRGISEGKGIHTNRICSALSRVLEATNDWEAVLRTATNPDLSLVISNTTEVGLQYVDEDHRQQPPASFPAKLLAWLHARYTGLGNAEAPGVLVIPTELISNNGDHLARIVYRLAGEQIDDSGFTNWLRTKVRFCNSLVDRIVPGKPSGQTSQYLQEELGYTDDLAVMCEPYRLWAIQGDETVRNQLSFAAADQGVVIATDITPFKELKLRLLNGTHTLSCGLAFFAGFRTVTAAMHDDHMRRFISELMLEEIAPAIPYALPPGAAAHFASQVLDRFSNPAIEHPWLNITLHYTSKIRMRIVEVLQTFVKTHDEVPHKIATGFAAYLLFMRPVKLEGSVWYGQYQEQFYPVHDEQAAWFQDRWQRCSPGELVAEVLANTSFWGSDLSLLHGFAAVVTAQLQQLLQGNVKAVLETT